MKLILGLCLLMNALNASAGLGACPDIVKKDSQVGKAQQFLKTIQGQFNLGSCHVEIHVCDEASARNSDDSNQLVADMLITQNGFERYIPFYSHEFNNRNSKKIIHNKSRLLEYRFRDWNKDPATGSFERWDLEIGMKDDRQSVDYMEIGFNSQVERQSEDPMYWINCGTEFEEYVRQHPVKYRVKSWWWWMTHPGAW